MNWIELSVEVDGEAAEAVAEALRPYAHGGVAIEQVGGPLPAVADEWTTEAVGQAVYAVRIYLRDDEAAAATLRRAEEALWHLGQLYPMPGPRVRLVAEEDWAEAWKSHFGITRIGRRLVVAPVWREYAPRPDDVIILLDPGMAFGTGLHPTTQMCLAAVEDLLRPGMRVLDVGTGSGILALAAAKLRAGLVLAVDTDAVAIEAARANAAANGVEPTVRTEHGSIELAAVGAWDLILANLLAPIIVRLLQDGLAARLRPGGVLVASGIIAEQADDVSEAIASAGLILTERRQIKDWITLIATGPVDQATKP